MKKSFKLRVLSACITAIFTVNISPTFLLSRAEAMPTDYESAGDITVNTTPFIKKAVHCTKTYTKALLDNNNNLYIAGYFPTKDKQFTGATPVLSNVLDVFTLHDSIIVLNQNRTLYQYKLNDFSKPFIIAKGVTGVCSPNEYWDDYLGDKQHMRYVIYSKGSELHTFGGGISNQSDTLVTNQLDVSVGLNMEENKKCNKSTMYHIYKLKDGTRKLLNTSKESQPLPVMIDIKDNIQYIDNGILTLQDSNTGNVKKKLLLNMYTKDIDVNTVGAINLYDIGLVLTAKDNTLEVDGNSSYVGNMLSGKPNSILVKQTAKGRQYLEFPSRIVKITNSTIYTEDKAYAMLYVLASTGNAILIDLVELPSKDIETLPSFARNVMQLYYNKEDNSVYRTTLKEGIRLDKIFTLPNGVSLVSCCGSVNTTILTDNGKVFVGGVQTDSTGNVVINYTSGEILGLGVPTIATCQQVPLDIFSKWVEPKIINKSGVSTWTAPKDGEVTLTCIGGNGSICNNSGVAMGDLQVKAKQNLYCVVGSDSTGTIGGYNGGGNGCTYTHEGASYTARGGGGATDVRTAPTSPTALSTTLMSRIIVAGGGGGDLNNSSKHSSSNSLTSGWGGKGDSIDSYERNGYSYNCSKDSVYKMIGSKCFSYLTPTNRALLGEGEHSQNSPSPKGGAGGGGYIGGGVQANAGGQGGANFTGGVSNSYSSKATLLMKDNTPKVIIQYKDNPLSNIIISASPSQAVKTYNKLSVELEFSHITSDGHNPDFIERKYIVTNNPTPPKDLSTYNTYNSDSHIDIKGTGDFYLHAYAKDVEGNEAFQTFGVYTLGSKDATQDGSIVPVITASTTEWTNKDVMIIVKPSSKDFKYLEYKIGNGNWKEYYKPFPVTEEGVYKVYARAKNKDGDFTQSSNVEVKIDKTPPVISMSGLREEIVANSPTEKSHYWDYYYIYSKKGHRRTHWKQVDYNIDHIYSLASFTVEDKKKGSIPCSGCIPDTVRVNDKTVQSGRVDSYTTPTGAYLVSKTGETLTCAYKINLKVHDRYYGNTQTTSNCRGRNMNFDYTNYPSSPKLATPHDYRIVLIAKDRAGNVAMLMPSLLSKFDPDVFIAGNKMDVFREDKKDGHTFRKETLIFNDKEQFNLTVIGQIYTNKEPLRLDVDEITEDGVPVHIYEGKVFNSVADDFAWHKSDNNDDHSLNEIDDLVRFTYDLPIRMNLSQPLATKYFRMKVVGFNSGNTYYNNVYKVNFANNFADNYMTFRSNGSNVSASFKPCISQLEALKGFNINRNQMRWKISNVNELGQQTADLLKSKINSGSSISSSLYLGSNQTTINNRRLLIGQPNVFGVVKDIGNPVEIQFLNVTKDPIITDSQFTVQVHVRANEQDYYLPTDLQKLKNDGIHIQMIKNSKTITENMINVNDFVFDKNYSEDLSLTVTDTFNNTKTSSTKLLFLNKNGIASGIRVKNDNSYVLTTKGIFDITSKFFTEIKIPNNIPDLPFDTKVPYRGYKLSNGNILIFSNINSANPLINIYNSSLKLVGHISLPVSTPVLDIIEYQDNVYIATGFNGLYKVPISSFSNPTNLMATKEVSTTAYYMETFSNLLLLGSQGSQALQTFRISENNLVQENCIPANKIYEDNKYTSIKEIHVNGSSISVYPDMSNGSNTAFHVVISFLK